MSTHTVERTQNLQPNHVAAVITRDGTRLGHVTFKGKTFTATRKSGSRTDVRRYSTGFRTMDAAIKWVEAAV